MRSTGLLNAETIRTTTKRNKDCNIFGLLDQSGLFYSIVGVFESLYQSSSNIKKSRLEKTETETALRSHPINF